MVSQAPVPSVLDVSAVESVLEDARWSSSNVVAESTNLRLLTLPGIVGGEFRARLEGLFPTHLGEAVVTICCTGWERQRSSSEFKPSSPDIYFSEVECLQVVGPSLEIGFVIPFEAKGTEEDATWQLQIQFANGDTEIFEVPVCRTSTSDPKITAVTIAAAGVGLDSSESESRSLGKGKQRRRKPFELNEVDGELHLRIPSRTPGHPSLAKGAGIICGIWAAATLFAGWIFFNETIEPLVILSIPLAGFSLLFAYALFGVSHTRLTKDKLIQRHVLFGIPIPRTTNRSHISGFAPWCVDPMGAVSGGQVSYFVLVKRTHQNDLFTSFGLFNQDDARRLAKQLNEFWGIGS